MRTQRARSDALVRSPRGERRGIQIGPRIRVGGTLGKIGQEAKIGAGKVLSNPIVDTALSFVPGVGPGIAAGARGLGTILDTSKGSVSPWDVAKNTAMQYGINRLAGGAWDAVKGALPSAIGGGGKGLSGIDIPAILKSVPGASSLGLTGGSGPGGIDIGTLLNAGLGGGALLNAANLQKQSSQYATDAFKQAQDAYNSRGGLRTAGIQNMLNPSAGIDLGGLSQIAQRGNPFARGVAPPQVGGIQVGQMGASTPGVQAPSTVLGQAASPGQAQQAMQNVQKYMQGGVGNLAGILRAAQGAV